MTPKSQAKKHSNSRIYNFHYSKLMFWNVFFEGAIYIKKFFPISDSKLMFWNVFFEGAIYLKFMIAD